MSLNTKSMRSQELNNWWVFPGFEIEQVATGLTLPVNLAFVPKPKDNPKAPLLYITELYGQVKVITNDGSVHTYAKNLLAKSSARAVFAANAPWPAIIS